MRLKADEKMVPYVIKLPPAMIAAVKEAAKKVKGEKWWRHTGVTTSAYIRRAITRDLAHAARSRDRRK